MISSIKEFHKAQDLYNKNKAKYQEAIQKTAKVEKFYAALEAMLEHLNKTAEKLKLDRSLGKNINSYKYFSLFKEDKKLFGFKYGVSNESEKLLSAYKEEKLSFSKITKKPILQTKVSFRGKNTPLRFALLQLKEDYKDSKSNEIKLTREAKELVKAALLTIEKNIHVNLEQIQQTTQLSELKKLLDSGKIENAVLTAFPNIKTKLKEFKQQEALPSYYQQFIGKPIDQTFMPILYAHLSLTILDLSFNSFVRKRIIGSKQLMDTTFIRGLRTNLSSKLNGFFWATILTHISITRFDEYKKYGFGFEISKKNDEWAINLNPEQKENTRFFESAADSASLIGLEFYNTLQKEYSSRIKTNYFSLMLDLWILHSYSRMGLNSLKNIKNRDLKR